MEVTSHVLTAEELAVLAAEVPERRAELFFRYWTRKEAVIKATGHGLATPLSSFGVSHPREAARLRCWTPESRLDERMRLHDIDAVPGYAAALATVGACDRITTHPTVPLLDLLSGDGP
jgi:4'-phosphopantetheinyl transferase